MKVCWHVDFTLIHSRFTLPVGGSKGKEKETSPCVESKEGRSIKNAKIPTNSFEPDDLSQRYMPNIEGVQFPKGTPTVKWPSHNIETYLPNFGFKKRVNVVSFPSFLSSLDESTPS
jgi:hypothetical protein